jgi:hypothetical protein
MTGLKFETGSGGPMRLDALDEVCSNLRAEGGCTIIFSNIGKALKPEKASDN